jgi:uncharacterized membrane protein YoaK (UPF0700 family)
MQRYDRSRQKLAMGLAFLAGQVDAIGFVVAGGYFTSFMSGNTTRLAVELIADRALAWIPILVIACFIGGVIAGALVAFGRQGQHKRILLAHDMVFLALAAAAMGVANNVFSREGEVTVGVTYMTGALVRSGQGVAARILGRPSEAMRGYPTLWLALSVGAIGGACLYAVDPLVAAAAAAGLALLLFAFAVRIETRAA